MALGSDEAWEIFFTRALGLAQRHVATAFMERNGYWIASGVRAPSRGTAIPFSRLTTRYKTDERAGDEWPQLAAPEDGMAAAELADLRDLVTRLPERQRAVVIMRYWQDAQERDIATSRPRHACARQCETARRLRARRSPGALSRASRCHVNDWSSHEATSSRTATRPSVLPSQPPTPPTTLATIGARISPIIPRANADAIA
jgi:hypothetical protein